MGMGIGVGWVLENGVRYIGTVVQGERVEREEEEKKFRVNKQRAVVGSRAVLGGSSLSNLAKFGLARKMIRAGRL